MKRTLTALAGLILLGACDGPNPLTGGGGGGGGVPTTPNEIPAALAGNLMAMGYDADADELTLELELDADTVRADYTRNPALDLPGYRAFTTQDDPLDRMFTALVAESFDGSVTAGVVADGGQFNRYFGGGHYSRNGSVSMPTTGLASYAGDYAGVTNIDGNSGQILPPPAGTDPSTLPAESARVRGNAFFNVDFAQNKINGAVSGRELVDYGMALDTIVMVSTDITADGSFNGTVELSDLTGIGTYGGVFGGDNAAALGGIVSIENFIEDIDNEQEYGVFVLTRCGLPQASPGCSVAEPLGD